MTWARTGAKVVLWLWFGSACSGEVQFEDPRLAVTEPALVGESQLVEFPSIPIAAANLPNGKIITWSSDDLFATSRGGRQTYTALFDPESLSVDDILVTNTSHDMFCPGSALLADGRVFANGGGTKVANTSIYDAASASWASDRLMSQPRWYNASVTLANGDVFTLGGNIFLGRNYDGRGERWSPDRGWRVLVGAPIDPLVTDNPVNRSQEHPRLFVAPNGKVFASGPSPNMQWYDVEGAGSVTSAGVRAADIFSQNDTTVMFDAGKLLKVGGNESYDGPDAAQSPSSRTAYVIDINSDPPTVQEVGPLRRARAYANGVVLPTGKVLVVGGLDNGAAFTDAGAVMTPELFDPATGTFSDVSDLQTPRTYHSVALLMPDGRVFVGGGGQCGSSCDANHFDAEIYSPSYLFQGARPQITSAPASADWGTTFTVNTTGAVSSFAWIRMSSVTHSVNTDQRRLPASSAVLGNGAFAVTAPRDGKLAPPGYYMLFALNGAVPSTAKLLRIGHASPEPQQPINLARGRPATQSSTYNGRAASTAVDGNLLDLSEADVTHTQREARAHFQVDLGSVISIGKVHVWNRADCCSERLRNFDVKLSPNGQNWPAAIHVAGQAGTPTVLDFQGQTGRFVRVQLAGTDFLSLIEVEVFAAPNPGAASRVCATAFESGNLELACPSGNFITGVDFASYGTPSGSCESFVRGSCDAASSVQVLGSRCVGEPSCSVPATNGTFGDPCSGTYKRLYAQVSCGVEPGDPPPQIVCATAYESVSAQLSCDGGKVISVVEFASYGTPTGMCQGFTAGNCAAQNSAEVVVALCVGRANCVVPANNGTFGDPCVGVYKNLNVQVRCE